MQVQAINSQPKSNLRKATGVAAKAATISAALTTASHAAIIAGAKKNPYYTDVIEQAKSGLQNAKIKESLKAKQLETYDDVLKICQNKKVDSAYIKKYATLGAKTAVGYGLFFGGVYLLCKTISDKIKSNKAE